MTIENSFALVPAYSVGPDPSGVGNVPGTGKPYIGKQQSHKAHREHHQYSLRDRIIYPIKVGFRRFIETACYGALAGMVLAATPAAIAGAVPGLLVGGGVDLLARVCGYRGKTSVAKILGSIGKNIASVMVGVPGAIVGGLAMAVCGVVRGIICLPLDIYRACSCDCLDASWSGLFSNTGSGPEKELQNKFEAALKILSLENIVLGKKSGENLTKAEVGKKYRSAVRERKGQVAGNLNDAKNVINRVIDDGKDVSCMNSWQQSRDG